MSTDSAAPSEVKTGVLLERDDGIRIVRLTSSTDALAYRAGFAGVYQTVFAEAPYNERFYPSEAQAVLRSHLENQDSIVLLAVKGISQVVGFGLAVPVMSRADVTRELRGLLPVRLMQPTPQFPLNPQRIQGELRESKVRSLSSSVQRSS